MIIDILTLFPEMFKGPLTESILRRAQEKSLVKINIHNLRDWAINDYGQVDDRPYSGGPGMILRVDVVDKALTNLKQKTKNEKLKTILLDAAGKQFSQKKAYQLSKCDHLIFICGHYEGVDYRVRKLVDEVISIGDFILTGGELPAMTIIDATVRLIPGVINKESLKDESFSPSTCPLMLSHKRSRRANHYLLSTNLEYPQYTRPDVYKGLKVPKVLLSGNHKNISIWKEKNKRNASVG